MAEDITYDRSESKGGGSTLEDLRCEIDAIDKEILELINRRLFLAIRIGRLKAELDEPIVDRERENSVVARLLELNEGPLQKRALQEIFSQLIAASRDIQEQPGRDDK